MKSVKNTCLVILALVGFQGLQAQTIVGSKHDFSTQAWNTSVGQQICIVCHTPHNASTTVTNAPLRMLLCGTTHQLLPHTHFMRHPR